MARVKRLKVLGEPAYYHIISRTVGKEFYLGDVEKEKLLKIIKRYSSIYFVKVIGFVIMSNHFHLLIKMESGDTYKDEDLEARIKAFYGRDELNVWSLSDYRKKLSDISEYVKSIKQSFSCWYNRVNDRTGYFWGDRFKSVLIERGECLLNCLAYIDLNSIRAGIVKRPEDYRWSSIGFRVKSNNRNKFLSFEGVFEDDNSLRDFLRYREFLYNKGAVAKDAKGKISGEIIREEIERDFKLGEAELFRYRIRYFTDGLVLGSRDFIKSSYAMFGGTVILKKDRRVHKTGLAETIFSIRRLNSISP